METNETLKSIQEENKYKLLAAQIPEVRPFPPRESHDAQQVDTDWETLMWDPRRLTPQIEEYIAESKTRNYNEEQSLVMLMMSKMNVRLARLEQFGFTPNSKMYNRQMAIRLAHSCKKYRYDKLANFPLILKQFPSWSMADLQECYYRNHDIIRCPNLDQIQPKKALPPPSPLFLLTKSDSNSTSKTPRKLKRKISKLDGEKNNDEKEEEGETGKPEINTEKKEANENAAEIPTQNQTQSNSDVGKDADCATFSGMPEECRSAHNVDAYLRTVRDLAARPPHTLFEFDYIRQIQLEDEAASQLENEVEARLRELAQPLSRDERESALFERYYKMRGDPTNTGNDAATEERDQHQSSFSSSSSMSTTPPPSGSSRSSHANAHKRARKNNPRTRTHKRTHTVAVTTAGGSDDDMEQGGGDDVGDALKLRIGKPPLNTIASSTANTTKRSKVSGYSAWSNRIPFERDAFLDQLSDSSHSRVLFKTEPITIANTSPSSFCSKGLPDDNTSLEPKTEEFMMSPLSLNCVTGLLKDALKFLPHPKNFKKLSSTFSYEEIAILLMAVKKFGRDYEKISQALATKNPQQVEALCIRFQDELELDKISDDFKKQ